MYLGFTRSQLKLFHHLLQGINQLTLCDRDTHYFVISFCINKVKIAYDPNELSVVDFWYQHFFKIIQNSSEISREWTKVSQVCVRHRMSLFLQFSHSTLDRTISRTP